MTDRSYFSYSLNRQCSPSLNLTVKYSAHPICLRFLPCSLFIIPYPQPPSIPFHPLYLNRPLYLSIVLFFNFSVIQFPSSYSSGATTCHSFWVSPLPLWAILNFEALPNLSFTIHSLTLHIINLSQLSPNLWHVDIPSSHTVHPSVTSPLPPTL